MTRIVVVDNDVNYASSLRQQLEIEGYDVDIAADAETARTLIEQLRPDLVLLELGLPSQEGYAVLDWLREGPRATPTVILTVLTGDAHKVHAFDLGADDYITKPVGIRLLLARVLAILRRTYPDSDRGGPSWIRVGDISIHPPSRAVRARTSCVKLGPKEYQLLCTLLKHRGQTVTRGELLREVWSMAVPRGSRTVDTHIAELRRKLEQNPRRPRHIVTIRRAGYMLRDPFREQLRSPS